MNNARERLVSCFQVVFPDLQESQIVVATQQSTPQWDSIAAITLMNVIEDEFAITLDFDELAELDSFPGVLSYVESKD
jgi:acyl carrier protein